MVTPGRFKHFKGGEYRVLFTAPWWVKAPPDQGDDARVHVLAFGVGDPPEGGVCVQRDLPAAHSDYELILAARWVGEKVPAQLASIVIYCNLEGVYARTEVEFEEVLPGDLHCERFTRIGE